MSTIEVNIVVSDPESKTVNVVTQGPKGDAGKSVLSGNGAPSNELGNDGDFYIDLVSKLLHGPKTSGAWLSSISLVGPAGANGADGTDGEDGIDGTDGLDGNTILSGSGAPSSGLGTDGDLYYDTDNNQIYGPKALGAWGAPISIIGPAGPAGADGADGNDGAAGAQGADGVDGVDGKTVLNGSGAPGAGLGSDGDFYLDTDNHDLYGPKAAGVWGSATSLIGPQGPAGADGAPGGGGEWTSVFGEIQTTNDDETDIPFTGLPALSVGQGMLLRCQVEVVSDGDAQPNMARYSHHWFISRTSTHTYIDEEKEQEVADGKNYSDTTSCTFSFDGTNYKPRVFVFGEPLDAVTWYAVLEYKIVSLN